MENRFLSRGKRIDNGEWIFGNLIRTDDGVYIIQNYVPQHLIKNYEVDQSTVCQCTGLNDKNGKLIWENDVCDRKEEYPEIVKYNKGDWTLDYSYSKDRESGYCYCNLGFYVLERKCVEVIGNVFDNPELLEV